MMEKITTKEFEKRYGREGLDAFNIGDTISSQQFERLRSGQPGTDQIGELSTERISAPFSPTTALRNIPSSAGRLVGDIFQAIRHPIKTAKGLGSVAVGAVQKAIPGEQAQEQAFDAVVDFFKERYGSAEALKTTVEQDPVGFAADISALLTGGGLATRGAGAVTRSQQVARAGQAVQTAGLAVEPLTAMAKGVFISTKPIGAVGTTLGREILGVTTGAGGEVIRQAFRNPTKEFRQALRGQTTTENILTAAREGLDTMRTQRASTYRTQLSAIKENNKAINIKPFREFIDTKLKEFNIISKKDGTLDFGKSVIADRAEARRVAEVVDIARKWKETTPLGLDTLKQRLDDFYSPSGKARALTNSLRGELNKTIQKNVPGYADMTKSYQEATQLIKEIEATLSLKPGVMADTTIRKLTSAMKQNNEIRMALVGELDALTGQNMAAQLAGKALSPSVPSGLIGRSMFPGIVGGGFFINPNIWFGLLFSSPRVVGEFLNVLGLSANEAKRVSNWLTSPAGKEAITSAFQAGRLEEVTEPEQ